MVYFTIIYNMHLKNRPEITQALIGLVPLYKTE